MHVFIDICLYLGILAGLSAPIVMIIYYYRAPLPPAPEQPAPAPAETALDAAPVLVTFIADTPWGNAGETLPGTMSRLENGQEVVSIDDECGMTHTIDRDELYARIQELRTLHTSR